MSFSEALTFTGHEHGLQVLEDKPSHVEYDADERGGRGASSQLGLLQG